jgi:hypothetical protein
MDLGSTRYNPLAVVVYTLIENAMHTTKVGIREFRENLSSYLE